MRLWSRGLLSCDSDNITREPLSKSIGDGLFELRHVGKLNTRIMWFFMKEQRIIAVHGVRNKGQTIARNDLRLARERMADWKKRVV